MSGSLDSELWKRVEPVLDRALELEGAQREQYLAGVFDAEPDLRAEVESLLAADESRDGVLDRAPPHPGQDLLEETHSDEGDLTEPREIGPYRLLREIGAGGMGVVYEALDLRLQRRVALKFLPREQMPSDSQLARFQREAKGLARLNHPNIVTLYSVEEHDGVPFITMELVEGVTLASLVPPGGLPLDSCLAYSLALSDALEAAHQRDIVHRDLKPANVMVTGEGRVKLLDLGLAKLSARDPTSLTQGTTEYKTASGAVMGTVLYMSPEQLEGKEVDHRTDIFSFGALLYEMVTGVRPFDGDSSASIISAILRDTPRTPTELRSDLPVAFGEIIDRCLEKQAERRYSSAAALRRDLEELKQGLDSDAAVASRTSMTSKRRLVTAALALMVGVIGAGLWLVRSETGSQTPGRPTEAEASGAQPGEALSRSAAVELPQPAAPLPTENMEAYFEYLRGMSVAKESAGPGRYPRAVHHFQRAVELDPDFAKAWAKLSIQRAMSVANGVYPREEREAMIEASENEAARALELAPDDPMARLTRGYHSYYFLEDYDRAYRQFMSVLEEGSDDLETDIFITKAMAAIQRRRGEYEESLMYFERAMSLEPADAEAGGEAAKTYLAVRNHGRAAELFDRLIVADPDEQSFFFQRAWVEIKATGSLDRARTFLEQSPGGDGALPELSRYERDWSTHLAALAEIEPAAHSSSRGVWHVLTGHAHRHLGNEEEARRHFESALEISERLFVEADLQAARAPVLRGLALAYLGRNEEAVRLASSLPHVLSSGDHYTGPRVGEIKAEILAVAGDAELAVDQLERMLSVSYIDALTLWDLRLDPIWDPLRDHPRFRALVGEAKTH